MLSARRFRQLSAKKLVGMLSHFANTTPQGRSWIEGLQYGGLRPPTAAEMNALDDDVTELRQVFNINQTTH
jgi:hypothetical protein